jgi:PPM family protein phosphatase
MRTREAFRRKVEVATQIAVGRPLNHRWFWAQAKGTRDEQQDACLMANDLGLYGVWDGLGGEPGGGQASRLAAEVTLKFVRDNGDAPLNWLASEAIISANKAILTKQLEWCDGRRRPCTKMGTTALILAFRDRQAIIAHVGDSRAYRFRGGQLERMTEDHSCMEVGNPYPALTRSLGHSSCLEELRLVELAHGDLYLLATDGLREIMTDSDVEKVCKMLRDHPDDSTDVATELVELAMKLGTTDNTTVVGIEFYDR